MKRNTFLKTVTTNIIYMKDSTDYHQRISFVNNDVPYETHKFYSFLYQICESVYRSTVLHEIFIIHWTGTP